VVKNLLSKELKAIFGECIQKKAEILSLLKIKNLGIKVLQKKLIKK